MLEVCSYKTKVQDKYANIIFRNLQTQRMKSNQLKLRKWNRHLFVTGAEHLPWLQAFRMYTKPKLTWRETKLDLLLYSVPGRGTSIIM